MKVTMNDEYDNGRYDDRVYNLDRILIVLGIEYRMNC